MCDYQGYEFGAGQYPDSVCMEGYLWDADSYDGDTDSFSVGGDIPCPNCNKENHKIWSKDKE